MLCAKLGHWPFANPPHRATCAQVNLLSTAFVSMLPKPQTKGNMAPLGTLDKRSMRQWRAKLGQPTDE